jgi:hypothetical protein
MKPGKHKEIDDAIVAAIVAGHWQFSAISAAVTPLVKSVFPETADVKDPWRVVDRRLQAMRKGGRLIFLRGRGEWAVVKK